MQAPQHSPNTRRADHQVTQIQGINYSGVDLVRLHISAEAETTKFAINVLGFLSPQSTKRFFMTSPGTLVEAMNGLHGPVTFRDQAKEHCFT